MCRSHFHDHKYLCLSTQHLPHELHLQLLPHQTKPLTLGMFLKSNLDQYIPFRMYIAKSKLRYNFRVHCKSGDKDEYFTGQNMQERQDDREERLKSIENGECNSGSTYCSSFCSWTARHSQRSKSTITSCTCSFCNRSSSTV